jgi:hypothetical protein
MEEQIKFLKLRTGEDIVAYTEDDGDFVKVRRPVVIIIENIFEEARQLLNVREWLPLIVVRDESISLSRTEIVASLDVNDEFLEQYKELCEMFFDTKPTIKKKKKKVIDGDDKVISMAEAIASLVEKKDKPIH